MKRTRIVVGVCLLLFLSSCGPRTPPEFTGGGAEKSDQLISQWQQQGTQFYVGVWHKDPNDPAFLLVARVPTRTCRWGSIFTHGYKFELADRAQEKSWAVYEVVPESSKESLVIAEQSYDLDDGRVFVINVSEASPHVLQIDANTQGISFSLGVPSAFATLEDKHQRIKDILHRNR